MTTHRMITPSILYFGTPVTVVSSLNADGTANLSAISSYWALGDMLVLGVGDDAQTMANVRRHRELVLNMPDESQWREVDALGQMTGANPVPASKPADIRFVADKFAAVGWHELPAVTVAPPRVAELPVHLECRVEKLVALDGATAVTVRCTAVHVHDELTIGNGSHIDPQTWHPLIYNFRHYYGLGPRQGIAAWADQPAQE